MPLPSPTESPSCPICGLTLADGPTIPTTSGGAVHIRCAERQASAAARRRAVRAALSAVLLLGVGGWGLGTEGRGLGAEGWGVWAVLTVLLIAAHVLINRRWWRYTIQRARRSLGFWG